MTHGRTGYERHRCRCSICRAANAAKVAATRARRRARLLASPSPESDDGHGTQGGYDAGCRCEACRLVRRIRYWRAEGGPRRHLWRERVTVTYRSAREAWERLLEAETGREWSPGLLAWERRRERRGGRREVTDFLDRYPPPTLGAVLTGLAGENSPTNLLVGLDTGVLLPLLSESRIARHPA